LSSGNTPVPNTPASPPTGTCSPYWAGIWCTTAGIACVKAASNAHPTERNLPAPVTNLSVVQVRRRKVLHGLINEYEQAA